MWLTSANAVNDSTALRSIWAAGSLGAGGAGGLNGTCPVTAGWMAVGWLAGGGGGPNIAFISCLLSVWRAPGRQPTVQRPMRWQ
jgi:hypothetical protein